jgi:hypothetical protein
MHIILIEKKKMQNPAMIIVSLQDRHEGLNIARWAVAVRNAMCMTNGLISKSTQQ